MRKGTKKVTLIPINAQPVDLVDARRFIDIPGLGWRPYWYIANVDIRELRAEILSDEAWFKACSEEQQYEQSVYCEECGDE